MGPCLSHWHCVCAVRARKRWAGRQPWENWCASYTMPVPRARLARKSGRARRPSRRNRERVEMLAACPLKRLSVSRRRCPRSRRLWSLQWRRKRGTMW